MQNVYHIPVNKLQAIYLKACCCLVVNSCLTLCNSMDCSQLGSSVHGIFQARILQWVAISFSRGPSWPRDWTHVSCIGWRILYHWATREAPVNISSSHFLFLWVTYKIWTDWSLARIKNHNQKPLSEWKPRTKQLHRLTLPNIPRRTNTKSSQILPKNRRGGILSNTVHRESISLILKTRQGSHKKKRKLQVNSPDKQMQKSSTKY